MRPWWPLLALALAAAAAPAHAADSYFVVLLAYQDAVNLPKESHTAAVFARASADGEVTEAFTISWLPARLKGRPGQDIHLLQRPEPGANFTLPETLALGRLRRRRLTRWGPFQVRPELYAAALRRYRFLDSGAACYTVLDGGVRGPAFRGRPGGAVNCMHAVSDLFGAAPLRTGLRRGASGTEAVLVHFLAGNRDLNFVRYPAVQEWLAARLGVSAVPEAARLPLPSRDGGSLGYVTLAELERLGEVRRTLDGPSPLFAPGVGVRLLPPEALNPWRSP